jgi:methylated-DNA-protein-cysteine methyltransferase-like protein
MLAEYSFSDILDKKNIAKWGHMIQDEQKNPSFFEQVYEVVARIPCGKVISYGQIAAMLGRPRAAREVGWALSGCPDELPWQRVVMADGKVTGGTFAELRRTLLREEGIQFLKDGRVDMDAHRWDGRTPIDQCADILPDADE